VQARWLQEELVGLPGMGVWEWQRRWGAGKKTLGIAVHLVWQWCPWLTSLTPPAPGGLFNMSTALGTPPDECLTPI